MVKKAVVVIVIPAAALLSLNCGLLTFPVAVPSALAKNAHQLDFTVEVTDAAGNPLNGVTANITRYAVRFSPLMSQAGDEQSETRALNGTFRYSGFGKYAVSIEFSKDGYEPVYVLFADKPNPQIAEPFLLGSRMPRRFDMTVDVDEHPRNRVILHPATK